MKRYVVCLHCTATEENINFAGMEATYYYGKDQKMLASFGSFVDEIGTSQKMSDWAFDEYGYKRECDAKKSYIYKNPDEGKHWNTEASIIEIELPIGGHDNEEGNNPEQEENMKQANITTKTFELESRFFKDFLIDIVETEDHFDSWIYIKGGTTKKYLIGFGRDFDRKRTIEDFTAETLDCKAYIEEMCFEYLHDEYFNDDDDCEC